MVAIEQAPAGAAERLPGPATGFLLWRYDDWQIELNLRSLKTILQMDILRGKTPDIVRKEVWLHLLAYNVVRRLMAQAAVPAGVRPDQLSFTGALHALNAFLPASAGGADGSGGATLAVVPAAADQPTACRTSPQPLRAAEGQKAAEGSRLVNEAAGGGASPLARWHK